MDRKKTLLFSAGVFAAVLAVDQFTKELIRTKLALGETIPANGGFFCIYHTKNEGVAFSMLEDHPKLVLFLQSALLLTLTLAFLYVLLKKQVGTLPTLAFSLIVAGGFGNLIDRIARGYVTDFFSVGTFPVFNVADGALTSGCGLILLYLILEEIKEKKKKRV
jgi:signal peptidase II